MTTTTMQQNKPLSVSEAMAIAKGALESCTVTLIGEVSEVSNKPGYKAVYFTVKDEGSSLPAMMWMNKFHASGVDLRVGMLVQLTGRFTLYAPKGRMNFDVFSLALAGEGDLRQKVADLAKKLKAEGLMEPSRKRAIPLFPETVGLVTSPRGAAVHDVLRTLRRRFPAARIVLAGVPVEGVQAPQYLSEGLTRVAQAGAEVVLLVRGGGSFEDLMPFNDESLARRIATLPVPVVTGIGHEPDTSIADMVADLRASTPTAAAEAIAPDTLDIQAQLASTQAHTTRLLQSRLQQSVALLNSLANRPSLSDGQSLFATEAQSLDYLSERLQRAIPNSLQRDRAALVTCETQLRGLSASLLTSSSAQHALLKQRLKVLAGHLINPYDHAMRASAARLEDLSPLSVLGRGFALAKDSNNSLIKSISSVTEGSKINVAVSDGNIHCTVDSTTASQQEVIEWKES